MSLATLDSGLELPVISDSKACAGDMRVYVVEGFQIACDLDDGGEDH